MLGAAVVAAPAALMQVSTAVAAPNAAGLHQATLGLPAPLAAGDSAGNMTLNGRSKWVLVRWVARRTGTLTALDLRIQADGSACRRSGRHGYGLGNGGSWHATTHTVLPDGRPDTSHTLATNDFRPCRAGASLVDVRQGIVRLGLDLSVVKGAEYATIVRNRDPAPERNYTSPNFLYLRGGAVGANARNERSPAAGDAYYGLDPRELVGYSSDGGRHWALPGGQYGRPRGRNFLPTYVQEYASGAPVGQPYYHTRGPTRESRTMVFSNVTSPWVIRALGAYTGSRATGTLSLSVDGVLRARVPAYGAGMLRAAIPPTTVLPGQSVAVTSRGLAIAEIVADGAWGRLMGLTRSAAPWRLQGQRDLTSAVPIYPLPACGGACAPGYGGTIGVTGM